MEIFCTGLAALMEVLQLAFEVVDIGARLGSIPFGQRHSDLASSVKSIHGGKDFLDRCGIEPT